MFLNSSKSDWGMTKKGWYRGNRNLDFQRHFLLKCGYEILTHHKYLNLKAGGSRVECFW